MSVSKSAIAGSSPRMRGTLSASSTKITTPRFIPAHAGNTQPADTPLNDDSVHPRACGEHSFVPVVVRLSSGSSPRMRGTRLLYRRFEHHRRFIPAHAGNTFTQSQISVGTSVHPRACGEHLPDLLHRWSSSGSSPRMRGTHRLFTKFTELWRFIPAHAGNTSVTPGMLLRFSVHPRACGEHTLWPTIA